MRMHDRLVPSLFDEFGNEHRDTSARELRLQLFGKFQQRLVDRAVLRGLDHEPRRSQSGPPRGLLDILLPSRLQRVVMLLAVRPFQMAEMNPDHVG